MLVALGSGYVRFAPKFPAESWLWVWSNLFLTCLAEETVFRGFLLHALQRIWGQRRGGTAAAVGVAAILFGVAHYAGGLAYVALATLAGIGYGWAYVRTRSIEAAVLTHFALNAVHFFGFTYPALAR
jgi:membrane protease YdiL (CAAX protease family)